MLVQPLPQHRPVSTPMHRAHPARRMLPPPIAHPRLVRLERRVRMAEHRLAQVPQAVLDVVRRPGAVRHEGDADGVQAVQLVHHRDQEGPPGCVRGPGCAEGGEAVGEREERAPVVVCGEGEVGGVGGEDECGWREVERELSREVIPDVACGRSG